MPEPYATWNPETGIWERGEMDLFGRSEPFSVTFPPSGSMRTGRLYALQTSAPAISEPGYSSSPTLPTPLVGDAMGGRTASFGKVTGTLPGAIASLLPTPRATDGTNGGPNQRGSKGDLMLPSAVAQLLPTPRASDGSGGPNPLARPERQDDVETRLLRLNAKLLPTPSASDGTGGGQHPDRRVGHSQQLVDYALVHGSPRWGDYEPAIRRQEMLSRPAPAPTEPNRNGNQRLSATFAEWMMFWPAGWVTDPAIGLKRNEQLRIVGNGVVPRQAVAAFRHLLNVGEVAA